MTASPATPVPPDPLAALVSPDDQRKAARMAQDAFAQVFRRSVGEASADDAGAGLVTSLVCLTSWYRSSLTADNKSLAVKGRGRCAKPVLPWSLEFEAQLLVNAPARSIQLV